ncbi:MAG: ribonuclease P protein component [Oligoflexia bacterium]|nr:ribonuclease P protein component [Oligoflexia bacterium]
MNQSKYSYGKNFRLRSKRDFLYLKSDSGKCSTRHITIYFKESSISASETRIGQIVSRKVGKAHFRNRLKRILREDFRLSDHKDEGFDFVVVVVPHLAKNFSDKAEYENIIRRDFKRLLLDASKRMTKSEQNK